MAPKTVKPNGKGASAPKAAPTPKKAAKKAKKLAATQASKTSNYIRNLHNGAGGARVDLTNDRRILLAPRGQVGDIVLVTESDRDDPMYQRNVDFLFEELTLEQGAEVIDKQNTNAQAHRSSPMDFITNELGQKYAQTKATITATHESQGQVVGQVSPSVEGQSPREAGNITRAEPVMGPQEVQVPGSRAVFDPNVMPAGLSMEQAQLFMQTPPEQRELLLQQFQQESYREGLSVSVEPSQRG